VPSALIHRTFRQLLLLCVARPLTLNSSKVNSLSARTPTHTPTPAHPRPYTNAHMVPMREVRQNPPLERSESCNIASSPPSRPCPRASQDSQYKPTRFTDAKFCCVGGGTRSRFQILFARPSPGKLFVCVTCHTQGFLSAFGERECVCATANDARTHATQAWRANAEDGGRRRSHWRKQGAEQDDCPAVLPPPFRSPRDDLTISCLSPPLPKNCHDTTSPTPSFLHHRRSALPTGHASCMHPISRGDPYACMRGSYMHAACAPGCHLLGESPRSFPPTAAR
jgi:hypothetical protein